MSEAEDPRARFRHLPEPIRLDETLETSDVNRPVPTEEPPDVDVRLVGFGPGTP